MHAQVDNIYDLDVFQRSLPSTQTYLERFVLLTAL